MRRRKILLLLAILLGPILIYFGFTAYAASFPCINDTGDRYSPAPGYSCAPQPLEAWIKSSSLYTNGTFVFLIISGGPINISVISIVPNNSMPTTAYVSTNMTCIGLVPINYSPMTERCTFSGVVINAGQAYDWDIAFNNGQSSGGTVIAKPS